MTAAWVDDTWLAIDTETTGIDVWSDRIVQVAAVQVHPDGSTGDSYCTIVNPGVEIPEAASAIHHITTARACEEGVAPAVALEEMARRIFDHGHRPVVGFNMGFDWPILLSEAERHGVEFPFLAPVLDPYLVDKMMDQFRRGSRKLVAVAEHYAVELDEADAHGALADAVAAARVMRAIVARYPQIGERTLGSVFLRQVRGHERWRDGFIDYKQRQGDRTFTIPPGWPIPALVKGGLPVVDNTTGERDTPSTARPEDPPPPVEEGQGPAELTPSAAPAQPGPETHGTTPADVATLARRVFGADYDAAPRGSKTKVLARLRHAFTWACTGRVWSLEDCTPTELAAVYNRLTQIEAGQMGYQVLDDGVAFTVAGSTDQVVISWEQLHLQGAAA